MRLYQRFNVQFSVNLGMYGTFGPAVFRSRMISGDNTLIWQLKVESEGSRYFIRVFMGVGLRVDDALTPPLHCMI